MKVHLIVITVLATIAMMLLLSFAMSAGPGKPLTAEPVLIAERDGIKVYALRHGFSKVYFTSTGSIATHQ